MIRNRSSFIKFVKGTHGETCYLLTHVIALFSFSLRSQAFVFDSVPVPTLRFLPQEPLSFLGWFSILCVLCLLTSPTAQG